MALAGFQVRLGPSGAYANACFDSHVNCCEAAINVWRPQQDEAFLQCATPWQRAGKANVSGGTVVLFAGRLTQEQSRWGSKPTRRLQT